MCLSEVLRTFVSRHFVILGHLGFSAFLCFKLFIQGHLFYIICHNVIVEWVRTLKCKTKIKYQGFFQLLWFCHSGTFCEKVRWQRTDLTPLLQNWLSFFNTIIDRLEKAKNWVLSTVLWIIFKENHFLSSWDIMVAEHDFYL